jgi:hypothetical protein
MVLIGKMMVCDVAHSNEATSHCPANKLHAYHAQFLHHFLKHSFI